MSYFYKVKVRKARYVLFMGKIQKNYNSIYAKAIQI